MGKAFLRLQPDEQFYVPFCERARSAPKNRNFIGSGSGVTPY
jgi:hypothetical protein